MRDISADEFRHALDHGSVLHPKQIEERDRHVPLGPGEYRCGEHCFCCRGDRWIDTEKLTQGSEDSCWLADYVIEYYNMQLLGREYLSPVGNSGNIIPTTPNPRRFEEIRNHCFIVWDPRESSDAERHHRL